MGPVTTKKSRQDAWLRFGGVLRVGTGHAQYDWLETGAMPDVASASNPLEILNEIAQALDEAEARGRDYAETWWRGRLGTLLEDRALQLCEKASP